MLKLSRRSEHAAWLDLLPGVRVRMKPISTAMMLIARRAAVAGLNRPDPPEGEQHPALTEEQHAALSVGMVSSLVHQGLEEWEGIGDADGNPAPVSKDAVDALLDILPAFDAFDRLYYTPAASLEVEKNA